MIKPRLNETLDDIREALSFVDYLFPNIDEAKKLTGKETLDDIADCFLQCGVKTVVIKNWQERLLYQTRRYKNGSACGVRHYCHRHYWRWR